MDPDQVPWDRVVHFYGRADAVPTWIEQLSTDEHALGERALSEALEHQDSVIQATPLAVRRILRHLRAGTVRDPTAVRALLDRIAAAARYQIGLRKHEATGAIRADWSLFREDRLWPPFESEAADEVRWEHWDATDEELLGWALLTEAVLTGEGDA